MNLRVIFILYVFGIGMIVLYIFPHNLFASAPHVPCLKIRAYSVCPPVPSHQSFVAMIVSFGVIVPLKVLKDHLVHRSPGFDELVREL